MPGATLSVREILYNSMDARYEDQTVRVRLAIHEANDVPSNTRLDALLSATP